MAEADCGAMKACMLSMEDLLNYRQVILSEQAFSRKLFHSILYCLLHLNEIISSFPAMRYLNRVRIKVRPKLRIEILEKALKLVKESMRPV